MCRSNDIQKMWIQRTWIFKYREKKVFFKIRFLIWTKWYFEILIKEQSQLYVLNLTISHSFLQSNWCIQNKRNSSFFYEIYNINLEMCFTYKFALERMINRHLKNTVERSRVHFTKLENFLWHDGCINLVTLQDGKQGTWIFLIRKKAIFFKWE